MRGDELARDARGIGAEYGAAAATWVEVDPADASTLCEDIDPMTEDRYGAPYVNWPKVADENGIDPADVDRWSEVADDTYRATYRDHVDRLAAAILAEGANE